MITYRNPLDVSPGGVPLILKVSQYDSDFTLIFDLYSRKGTFTVDNGTTVRFREHKPDGNVLSLDGTLSGTVATLAPTDAQGKQMTAIAGRCECELTLFKNGKELNTANFLLLVEKAAVDIDAVQSDSIVRELYDVVDQADEILEAAEIMKEMLTDGGFKQALLNIFDHVAYTDPDGESYYNALSAVLDFSPFEIWYYDSRSTGLNKLTRTTYGMTEKTISSVKRGVFYADNVVSNNRRGFCVLSGVQPSIDNNGNETPYYPVPIPKTATKLTASIFPNTYQLAAYLFKYTPNSDPNGFDYTLLNTVSWHTGQDVVEFPADENLFIAFNCRVSSSNPSFTDEPELSLVFE